MHTELAARDDICVMMRASRFSADSHRHGDQGSFALFHGGKALISPSGYFGRRYGTQHHVRWTRTTAAHNVALIDGVGQLGGVDAVGRFLSFDKKNRRCVMELGDAYPVDCAYLREIALDEGGITVTDRITAQTPVAVTWPLHTLAQPEIREGLVTVERESCRLTITPLEGVTLEGVSDRFGVDVNEGEPEQYHVSVRPQYHITYRAEPKCSHLIRVRFEIT